MRPSVKLITIGIALELFNIFSLLKIPFVTNRGMAYLVGQCLVNVLLGLGGLVLLIIGIARLIKDNKENKW